MLVLFHRRITTSPSGEDFCPTGFTLTFWMRALRNTGSSSVTFRYIQGNQYQSINVVISGSVMKVGLDFHSDSHRCTYSDAESFYSKWNFIALTWNPTDKTITCAHNENVMVATKTTSSSARAVNGAFFFGTSSASVLFDDIVYFQRTSNEETLKEIYKASKCIVIKHPFILRHYEDFF